MEFKKLEFDFEIDEAGFITFTQEELQSLLDDNYRMGYLKGCLDSNKV